MTLNNHIDIISYNLLICLSILPRLNALHWKPGHIYTGLSISFNIGHPRKPFFFHLFFELRIIGTVYNLLECCRLTSLRRDLVFGPAFHILLFCIIFYANLESLVPLDLQAQDKTLKALLWLPSIDCPLCCSNDKAFRRGHFSNAWNAYPAWLSRLGFPYLFETLAMIDFQAFFFLNFWLDKSSFFKIFFESLAFLPYNYLILQAKIIENK